MNAKLLLKTIFLIVLLLLLVLIGVNNRHDVSFYLPPALKAPIKLQAAYMYYAFFAVGLLAGTILTAGGKKGSSGSGGSKSGGK